MQEGGNVNFMIKCLIGFFVFVSVVILTLTFGNLMGPGAYETGYIFVAIALLCAVVVICTLYIVEAIRQSK